MKRYYSHWLIKSCQVGSQVGSIGGTETKNAGMKKGKVKSHQPDPEGAGDERAMLIKVLPHGREYIRNMG